MAGDGGGSFLRDSKWVNLLLLVPLAAVAWFILSAEDQAVRAVEADAATEASRPLVDDDMPAVAGLVASLWTGTESAGVLPPRFADPARAVYVAARNKARRRASTWTTRGTVEEALAEALERVKSELGATAGEIDTLEIVLTHSYRTIDPVAQRGQLTANIHRGVRGLELSQGEVVVRHSPTYAVSSNRSNRRLIELFQRKHSLSDDAMKTQVSYRTFEADQLLVTLDPPRAHLLLRGNRLVPVEAVTQENVQELADLATTWLADNVHDDGRMTYMYWPSAREEAPGKNNMIRQWMATNALNKAAAARDDQRLWDVVERNIEYGLREFYKEDDGLGVIEFGGKAKLGSMSLAAMAIFEHPKRAQWASQEAALRRSIDLLWNEDGSFTTFAFPPGRSDQQNYYPGETLLFWATVYQAEPDEALRERFMKSFEYYRNWHLEPANRNPAFIPWHTQAYYMMWEETKDEQLRAFIFEMNDWLIDQMQQWEGDVIHPDALGRFHNPKKKFGAPHASSTGVYLEGLIDALRLARAVGDRDREERYRVAIVRALRSVMQLQFVDEIDMFYVRPEDRRYVHGGIRTTIYDNSIRCDNVQHNLMGIIKILREFAPADYAHP